MAQRQQQPPAILKTYFLKITFILLLHVTLTCGNFEDIFTTNTAFCKFKMNTPDRGDINKTCHYIRCSVRLNYFTALCLTYPVCHATSQRWLA